MAARKYVTSPLPRPSWLPADVWPFTTVTVDVDGTAIAVTESGNGPVLLFYTGIGSFLWRDVMARLAPEFRCVTLDPPGIGLSASVPRSATTLQRAARAIRGVIDALALDAVTLVVHDTAGPPAIAAAARVPARMRALVAVNTFGWRPSGLLFRGMLALMGSAAVRSLDVATDALARLATTGFGVGRHLGPADRKAYRAGIARGRAAFHDYLRDARREVALYDEVTRALTSSLSSLPLLTIFGECNDPFGFQGRWKALFPDARQVVLPKGNHFPMCDDPDLVAETIRSFHQEQRR